MLPLVTFKFFFTLDDVLQLYKLITLQLPTLFRVANRWILVPLEDMHMIPDPRKSLPVMWLRKMHTCLVSILVVTSQNVDQPH